MGGPACQYKKTGWAGRFGAALTAALLPVDAPFFRLITASIYSLAEFVLDSSVCYDKILKL